MRLKDLLQQWRQDGRPVLCVAAGSGQIATAAVRGGADLLMAISAGIYRQLGVGSLASYLPFGNSNELTCNLALREILPRAGQVPVMAGLMPEPGMEDLLARYQASGIQGVVNWPTISFVDGSYRAGLEAEGLNVEKEIELLDAARDRGLATAAFALNESDAARFASAGVDILILNIGLTHETALPAKRDQLQQEIKKLHLLAEGVRSTGRDPMLIVFGGGITQPEDYAQIVRQVSIHGFAGGSVFERIPVTETVAATVRDFRAAGLQQAKHAAEQGLGEIIGQSTSMKRLYHRIQQIAPYDVHVCIEGESGTGKELVATHLHRMSPRRHHPFVTVNCGAIPDTLLESELFGHEKGAFTGAHRRKLGKFEIAQNGTLFLDEIADLSSHGQVALLRAIQEREIVRVGGEHPIPIDVRIITASNQNLKQLVAEGKFRADLFYRLNQIGLQIPPLRERRDDLPLLVQALIHRLQVQLDRRIKGVSPEFMDRLLDYAWPGNVRELQHVMLQAALLEAGPMLKGKEIVLASAEPEWGGLLDPIPSGSSGEFRRKMVEQALSLSRGNKTRAAEMLGITRPTLYSWLKQS
jgi:DNA-binding NtrC family response regulator/predicted TIM-barrel enzyme